MENILETVKIIDLPVMEDQRGNLTYVQSGILPFDFKRVFYLFDVPSNAYRGGHCLKKQNQVLVALSGSFEVTLKTKNNSKTFILNKPNKGLHIPPGIWREMQNFSSGSVCLVFAQDNYDEDDYIREFEDFINF